MFEGFVIHFLGGADRFRAEGAQSAFLLGHHAEVYETLDELLERPPRGGLVIAYDDPLTGCAPEILARLGTAGIWAPLVAARENPAVDAAVAAIKAGALDYVALPLAPERLKTLVSEAVNEIESRADARRRMVAARNRIAALSPREREVLDQLAEGNSNKVIAQVLEISPRTVEIHRASMMRKLGARHAAEAVRLRLEAGSDAGEVAAARA
jgi:FixJ family two-component response regulator